MSRSMLVRWSWRSQGLKARRPAVNRHGLRVEPLEQRELLDGSGVAVVNNYSDLGPSGRLITGLYYDILGREPQVAEVAGWTKAIGSNLDNAGLAQTFINSDEYRAKILANDYQKLLNRPVDSAGLTFWLRGMRAGLTELQVLAGFLSSAEYFASKGGNNSAYVSGLYEDVLGRAADPFGLAFWTNPLQSGVPRAAVATAFIHSAEGLYRQVTDAYHAILGREPDAGGANFWVSTLKTGHSLEQVKVSLASSVEYFAQQLSVDLPAAGVPERHGQPAHSSGPWDTLFTIPPAPGNGQANNGPHSTLSGKNSNTFIHGSSQANVPVSHGNSVDFAEISLGVNPTNPLNLVVATAAITPGTTSALATFYSMDGGKTWHYVPIDAPVDKLTDAFAFRSDAEVRFDATGRVYVAYVALSKGPFGGIGSLSRVVVAHSTDGGKTYIASNVTTNALDSGFLNDKEIIATGRDPLNPNQQNVYVTWVRFSPDPTGTLRQLGTIMISGSTDGGATWSPPTRVSKVPHFLNQFSNPSVGPNGEIYVAFYDLADGQLVFASSATFSDGAFDFGSNTTITFVNDTLFKTPVPAQPSRGIAAIPKLVTDTSNGPFRGRIYIAYTDLPDFGKEPDTDVWLISSSDQGQTWTAPKRINDDATANSQFNVDFAVDPTTGGLTAEWRDTRVDRGNKKVDIFTATSADGGVTFSSNVRVSNKSSDMSGGQDPNDFLEYDGIAAYGGTAYYAWADNSNNPNGNLAIFFDSLSTGIKPITPPNPITPPPNAPPVIRTPDRFDPNETSDQAFFFGVFSAGTQTITDLLISRLPNGLVDNNWWRWQAGQNGIFTVKIDYQPFSGGDLNLRLFTLDSQNHLIPLGSSRAPGVTSQSVSVAVTAGEPVLAWVYGFNRAEAAYQMTITLV